MTSEELTAKLSALRGDVAGKSRSYAAALKDLDDVLKALKDPTKNAVALSEATGKLRKDGVGVVPAEELAPALEQLDEIAKRELDNAAFTFKRDLQAVFAEKNIGLETPGRSSSTPCRRASSLTRRKNIRRWRSA